MTRIRQATPEQKYLAAAIDLDEARHNYDHKSGNKAFDRLMTAAREVRLSRSDQGELFFRSLLAHELPHIVSAAAFNLIPLNPAAARMALERLAGGHDSEVRFNAELTLEEWSSGRLDPNWFMRAWYIECQYTRDRSGLIIVISRVTIGER